jgi:hypothetical protein
VPSFATGRKGTPPLNSPANFDSMVCHSSTPAALRNHALTTV